MLFTTEANQIVYREGGRTLAFIHWTTLNAHTIAADHTFCGRIAARAGRGQKAAGRAGGARGGAGLENPRGVPVRADMVRAQRRIRRRKGVKVPRCPKGSLKTSEARFSEAKTSETRFRLPFI